VEKRLDSLAHSLWNAELIKWQIPCQFVQVTDVCHFMTKLGTNNTHRCMIVLTDIFHVYLG